MMLVYLFVQLAENEGGSRRQPNKPTPSRMSFQAVQARRTRENRPAERTGNRGKPPGHHRQTGNQPPDANDQTRMLSSRHFTSTAPYCYTTFPHHSTPFTNPKPLWGIQPTTTFRIHGG